MRKDNYILFILTHLELVERFLQDPACPNDAGHQALASAIRNYRVYTGPVETHPSVEPKPLNQVK